MLNSPADEVNNVEMEAGFALVAVLGLMLIVSAVLLSFSTSARVRALSAEYNLSLVRYENIADIMARHAAERLFAYRENGPDLWSTAGNRASPCEFGGSSISLQVQDQSGLIDLNTASVPLLGIGFQALGFAPDKASELAFATDYFRRGDTGGSGLPQSAIRGESYKHSAFEDVLELEDFYDLQQIEPTVLTQVFTVQSASGSISVSNAPEAIRRLIATDATGAIPTVPSGVAPQSISVLVNLRQRERLVFSKVSIFSRSAGGGVAYQGSIPSSNAETAFTAQAISCPAVLDPPLSAAISQVLQ